MNASAPTPPVVTRTFDVQGMTCAACAARIEKVLSRTPGVVAARVNYALERADVELASGTPDLVVTEAVDRAGYEAAPRAADPTERRRQREAEEAERRASYRQTLALFSVSALLTAPFLVQMGLMMAGAGHLMGPWTEFVLAGLVQALAGARFYRGALKALKGGSANMDVLVAIGTTAAFAYSAALVLIHGGHAAGHLYFEASATVLTLVLLGKLLEARAKAGTTAAVRALMALRPEEAVRLLDGREERIGVERLHLGDRVLVRPGERVPVDGTVAVGVGLVDESLVTGESVPVEKAVGDTLVAGTTSLDGAFQVLVTAVGEDTTLARITRLVENAQSGKAPVQVLVDRVSAVFVPVVLAVAVVVFLGWLAVGAGLEEALVASVSVLVIACPCALGLATPTALVAGTGAAARAGILIKDIEALERAAETSVVIFDKTGTLTAGRPAVIEATAIGETSADAMLAKAAAVQTLSEHPLAKAVVEAAAAKHLALSAAGGFRSFTGRGVSALVDGRRIAIGNPALMAELQIAEADARPVFAAAEAAARTAVMVAEDDRVIGVIALADPVRPEAREAVAMLKDRAVESRMLTGDNAAVAARVAAEIGLSGWRGPVRPEDKAREVEALRKGGRVVAMVGDGINDAPALAAADVGIAMGTGTDVAMETAAVTLMRPDPRLVAAALQIAGATKTKISQNLFFAFVYNVIGIPLAALGLLTPALAGAAMALSSVSVVTNAGLLARWRPDLGGAADQRLRATIAPLRSEA